MRNMRYFVIIAVLLFSVVGYKTYEQYTIMENTRQEMLWGKGKSLSAFLSAFRETYQKAFVEHHIPIDDQTLRLLPVVTIDALSKNLSRKLNGDVQIRTVSDRPRNPDHLLKSGELLDWVGGKLQVIAYEHGIIQAADIEAWLRRQTS